MPHDPFDPYGTDVLAGDWKARGRTVIPELAVERDLVVEHAETGYCGAVIGVDTTTVTLEDRHGKTRMFPLGHGFLVDGAAVRLVRGKPGTAGTRGTGVGVSGAGATEVPGLQAGRVTAPTRRRTASGSFAVADTKARIALPSRIFVEGRHDAELVEKVWGADLRVEGVVVEYLEGVDLLPELLAEFRPGPGRRAGVLVDHLVVGSKEQRIADAVAAGPYGGHTLVTGHPFIDIWQAVKPERIGKTEWPIIPRGTEWKHGICEAFGWPHDDQTDIARAWRRILGSVRHFGDLEPALLGRVEELIDFVTA